MSTSETVVTVIAGFVGVGVGAAITPILAARVTERSDGRLASRVARAGLEEWVRAAGISIRATERCPKEMDFDLYLAHMFHSLSEILDLSWWQENKFDLLRRASRDDEKILIDVMKRCRLHLGELTDIGSAAAVVSETRKSITKNLASYHANSESLPAPPRPALGNAKSDFESGTSEKRTERAEERLHKAMDDLWRRLEDLQQTPILLDHRIGLARDAWQSFNGSRDKFEEGLAVCRRIESQNKELMLHSRKRTAR